MTARHLRAPRDVTPQDAGWQYSGLSVRTLAAGETLTLSTGDAETIVMPLQGSLEVTCAGETLALRGRRDVFSEVSDFAYVPRDVSYQLHSAAGARVALPSAVCTRTLPFRYGPAGQVPVELRGSGQASRQVNNVATIDTFETDKLIVVEVLTPAGNWSSYPPHKHDEDRPGIETPLEEIYYFEVSGDGPGFHRVAGETDLVAEVHSGDVVTVPTGWHGPSMAPPGYDLYYLNVMAGPGPDRAWLICDEPSHAWVRETWPTSQIDPRLPMATAPEGGEG